MAKRPVDYERRDRGDTRRFRVLRVNGGWEVVARGYNRIAMCSTSECAHMVADALETVADLYEDAIEKTQAEIAP